MNNFRGRDGANSNDPNPYRHLHHWQIIRHVKRIAKDMGYIGDPLEDNSQIGTYDQELAVIEIIASLPMRIRKLDRKLAIRTSKNVVRNSDHLGGGV